MPAVSKHIALLCTPVSKYNKAVAAANLICQLLDKNKVVYSVFKREWPKSLEGFTEAWIVGGDGTLNYFINQYVNEVVPLTIFAGGTGNDFHLMLYKDATIKQQVNQVLKGTLQRVDAGVCNNKLFLNGLGIGFDGAIVFDLLGRRKWRGKISYLISVLKNIAGYREENCQVTIHQQQFNQPFFMISVANGKRYGGGFQVTPKAQLNDGLLDVNLIGRVSLFQRLRYLPVIEKGRHLHLPFVRYQHAERVLIECKKPVHAHVDGEYFSASRFHVSVLPAHFSFLV